MCLAFDREMIILCFYVHLYAIIFSKEFNKQQIKSHNNGAYRENDRAG